MHKLPNSVRIEVGRGGLRRLLISTKEAEAEIYLHGAHVTHFQPRGQKPVLFLSGKSWFEPGKPIRGGVPICFPWFGTGQDGKRTPPHGFARLMEWELTSAEETQDGAVEILLHLQSNAVTHQYWKSDFEVDYRIEIGAALGMELLVTNPSNEVIRVEEALHTYLAVSDVRQVRVERLADEPRDAEQGVAPSIRIVEETDRIYCTEATCIVHDPGWQRWLVVEKHGSDTTVLWNPWIAKAKAMPDFGDDEWPSMLCIETCNVRDFAIRLAPGESHTMTATVRAESE